MSYGPRVVPRGTVIQSTVDANWASARLDDHNARRAQLGYRIPGPSQYHSPYDNNPGTSLPPALLEDRPPSSTPDRWASRFRDGQPPPPAPPKPVTQREVQRVLEAAGLDPGNPSSIDAYARGVLDGRFPTFDQAREMLGLTGDPASALVPQHQLDADPHIRNGQGLARPGTHPYPALIDPASPHADLQARRQRRRAPNLPSQGPVTVSLVPGDLLSVSSHPDSQGGPLAMAQPDALTPSQKRRLRRRRSRESREETDDLFSPAALSASPAMQPVPAPYTNGVGHPDPPAPPQALVPEIVPRTCNHISRVYIPTVSQWIELSCTIEMVPHPGQPHLLSVPRAYLDGAGELFIGWFAPGE